MIDATLAPWVVFPAPAGMNRHEYANGFYVTCVPRACGDEPVPLLSPAIAMLCSPRLRG